MYINGHAEKKGHFSSLDICIVFSGGAFAYRIDGKMTQIQIVEHGCRDIVFLESTRYKPHVRYERSKENDQSATGKFY